MTLGAQQAREQFRDRIDAALELDQHTVITRNGRPVAVLVPYSWYRQKPTAYGVVLLESDGQEWRTVDGAE